MMKVLFSCFLILMSSLALVEGGSVSYFSSVCFLLCLFMIFMYSLNLGGEYWIMMSDYFGYDTCSYLMILLTIWVVGLMVLSLGGGVGFYLKIIMFFSALMVLLMFFSVSNFMLLYIFFEVSLIPTFLIVYMWGKSLERMEAAFFLLFYMMFISLPLFAYLIKLGDINYSLDLNLLSLSNGSYNVYVNMMGGWDFVILFLAFFIKLPVYVFHIWLPKAHVEAPVYGSMLLAAVLLKLGGYGLIRMIMMFLKYCEGISVMVISVGLTGAVYVGSLCLVQSDMKSLVAYSSVVHMNFMMCSLFTLTKSGLVSALLLMVTHGLCSSGLFYMVNIFYKCSGSRLFILNKGYMEVIPSLGIFWFLLCSSNFSFPFSLNFLGEVIMFMVILGWSLSSLIVLGLVAFLSSAYSLYLYSMVYHGPPRVGLLEGSGEGGLVVDYMSFLFHYGPLLILLVNMSMFMF